MLLSKLSKPSLWCAGAALILLMGCDRPQASRQEMVVASDAMPSLSTNEALAASAEPSAAAEAADQKFLSEKTIETDFGNVIIKEVSVENPAHVSPGELNIYYMATGADMSRVRKTFPAAVQIGSWGNLGRWSVSRNLTGRPLIYAEGGGTWQGYTCSSAVLVELRPEGPAEIAVIPIAYDNSGAVEDGEGVSWEGKVTNIVQGKSFDVAYTGSVNVTQTYVRSGDQYRLKAKNPLLEGC